MTWETKRVLVAVKAYPEHSRKHGDVVCTAGITEDGEWIRLYPLPFDTFIGPNKVHRYSVIEVQCKPVGKKEKLGRRESHSIRPGTIRVVDRSLFDPADWDRRDEWLIPNLNASLEEMDDMYRRDGTSLGFIRPNVVEEFYSTGEILTDLATKKEYQMRIDGKPIPAVTRIPHQFKYRFKCDGCEEGREHNIQCEDWELFESYRSWDAKYRSPDALWKALHRKYYKYVCEERNPYFFMGMYSQQPSWLIIGLYYPPRRNAVSNQVDTQPSLLDF